MRRTICGAVALLALMAATTGASAQTLKGNQTSGYGEGQVLTFTYQQNFSCTEQPTDDLNFNGVAAAKDQSETQTPICQAGDATKINPPGQVGYGVNTTDPIYVLVPMFSVNSDQNPDDAISCTGVVTGTLCGPALGTELIQLFGAVPEAFKTTPAVFTQCPDNGARPGTCTMHASRIDLAPVLAALGYIGKPPTANVFVPTPNHSHVIPASTLNAKPEWWQVRPVLVLQQSDWPAQDGTTGISSVVALNAAIKAGRAVMAPSNFFLFFGSQVTGMNMPMGR
jgi:hypothetical protein